MFTQRRSYFSFSIPSAIRCAIIAVGLSAGLPEVCSAETIYSSLGGQYGVAASVYYDGPGGYQDGALGSQFTVGAQNYTLDRIGIATWLGTGPDDATMTLALREDDQGKPGAVLEAFTITMADVGHNTTLARSSVLHPLLMAGASYWITAVPSMGFAIAWTYNTLGMTANYAISVQGPAFTQWHGFANQEALAMIVEATPAAAMTPVPEPATLTLFGTGMLALGRRWRRRLA